METQQILTELEGLGDLRMKRIYVGHGAREPVYGVATGKMKPLAKRHMGDQPLAEALYQTGCYDAMCLAGMIADAPSMAEADFERWMDAAYFPMLSDYVVAVTLAESPLAQQVADRWIGSHKELHRSAGWRCYEWLLGVRKDSEFDPAKLCDLLSRAESEYRAATGTVQDSIDGFVATVGVSYIGLTDAARAAAIQMESDWALSQIDKAAAKGRIGFKRRAFRC